MRYNKIPKKEKFLTLVIPTILVISTILTISMFITIEKNSGLIQSVSAKALDSRIDVNGDKYINQIDFDLVAERFGEIGEPGWISEDINNDGRIDGLDLSSIIACINNYPKSPLPTGFTYLNVTPPSKIVSGSETFTVDVYLDPGEPIIMVQIDMSFNASLIQCNSVSNGNSGVWDAFFPPQIDNVGGLIHGACVVVLGSTVSDLTNCFEITFTAQGTDGTSPLTLHDVLMTNGTGEIITPTLNHGSVTVDNTVPVVTVVSPNGDEFWAGGSNQTITWAATDTNMADNPITLKYFDGSTWKQIATGEANDGVYYWDPVPSLDIDTAKVRVTAVDKAGNSNSDESDDAFTIDSTAPTITGITVTYSDPIDTDPLYGWENITCTVTDTTAGVKEVYIYIDGSPILMQKAGGIYYHNATLASGNHTFYIEAKDNAENTQTSSSDKISKAPNWDINMDGTCNGLDVTLLSLKWLNGDGSNKGWIREDINNDGYVNGLDVTQLSLHWLELW